MAARDMYINLLMSVLLLLNYYPGAVATSTLTNAAQILAKIEKNDATAGIQVAARQSLFDYASEQGLLLLHEKVQGLEVPDVTKVLHVPLLGDVQLQLDTIRIKELDADFQDAQLVILDGFFNMYVRDVGCKVSFNWHWEKKSLGLEGSGDGELLLNNGVINYVFSIAKDDETSRPKLDVCQCETTFLNS